MHAEPPHLGVECGDTAEILLLIIGQALIVGLHIFGVTNNRKVGSMKPDSDKEWGFLFRGTADEGESPVHDHLGGAAFERLSEWFSIMPEKGPHVSVASGRTMPILRIVGVVSGD